MDILKFGLRFVVIAIIYFIIIYALKLMYTDTKSAGKKKKRARKATYALEVMEAGDNTNLKKGSIVPIGGILTMGRKSDNSIVLDDKFVSSHHLKIYLRNNQYVLEDLDSTNGTKVNGELVDSTLIIKPGDTVKIGTAVFKMI